MGTHKALAADVGAPINIIGPLSWSDDAERGLADTFYGYRDRIVDGVRSGRMQLWIVNADSFLVTEVCGEMLFVWCYQGFGLVNLIWHLRRVALLAGLKKVSFFTRHRAAIRALRRFGVVSELTRVEGEAQYWVGAA